ncbi:hypothetical protein PJH57_29050 [Mycobacterium kansasii]
MAFDPLGALFVKMVGLSDVVESDRPYGYFAATPANEACGSQ